VPEKRMCNFVSTEKIEAQKKLFSTYQTNMTDNQEHEEPPQCYTYVHKDGETTSVSKATHSNIYDVVRYLVKEKQLTQPIHWGYIWL
jgi:hypothetical protein